MLKPHLGLITVLLPWSCLKRRPRSMDAPLLEWTFTIESQYWLWLVTSKMWICLQIFITLIDMCYVDIWMTWLKQLFSMQYFGWNSNDKVQCLPLKTHSFEAESWPLDVRNVVQILHKAWQGSTTVDAVMIRQPKINIWLKSDWPI